MAIQRDGSDHPNAQRLTSVAIHFSNVLDRRPVTIGSSKKCLTHNPNNCNGFLLHVVGNQLDFYKKFEIIGLVPLSRID